MKKDVAAAAELELDGKDDQDDQDDKEGQDGEADLDRAYDKWRARDDMRTVLEAARIQKDPKRMKAVTRCAREELAGMKAIKALAGTE